MPERGQVLQRSADAGAGIDDHRGERARAAFRAVPQPDHADLRVAEIGDEPALPAEVPEQHDRVAMAGFENGGQRQRLIRLGRRMTEHDGVPALLGLDREDLDGGGKERVGDVANDRAEQHRRRSPQRASERVRPVAELAGHREHALPRLLGHRDPRRRVVEDPRHRALRHPGGRGDILHGHRPVRLGRRQDRPSDAHDQLPHAGRNGTARPPVPGGRSGSTR